MEYKGWKEPANDEYCFLLKLSGLDLVRFKPNRFHRLLQEECGGSNLISDRLLLLEDMVRLIEIEEERK